MRTAIILPTQSAASDTNSGWFDLGDQTAYAIAVAITGSDVVGTLSLQGAAGTSDPNTDAGAVIATISNSSKNITGSDDAIYTVSDAGYRWVRLVWDYTSGTGNITAKIDVKEPFNG